MFSVDIAIVGTNDYQIITREVMTWLFSVAVEHGRDLVESFHAEYSREADGGGLVRCTATLSNTSALLGKENDLSEGLGRRIKESSPTSTIESFELFETARSLPFESSLNTGGYAEIDDDVLEISDF